jgi:hypothetical protein
MALTVVQVYKTRTIAGEFMSIIQVTGDSAYPGAANAHGYAITPATFFLNAFASTNDFGNQVPSTPGSYFNMGDIAPNASAGGAYCEIDGTTGNLRMYAAGGTEVASAATATAVSALLMAYGH